MKKFRWVASVLFLWMLSGSAHAIIVPDIECPSPRPPVMIAPCNTLSEACERADSSILEVSSGIPSNVSSSELHCNNCVSGCPEVVPPPLTCTSTLDVSYTEVVTATVAAGIETGSEGFITLKASLESSIGHSNERSKNFSATCGTNSLPGCTKASYALVLGIVTGIQKKIEHTYKWKVTTGHNSQTCAQPTDHTGPYPYDTYYSGGMAVSTVTGAAYGTATCQMKSYSSVCP